MSDNAEEHPSTATTVKTATTATTAHSMNNETKDRNNSPSGDHGRSILGAASALATLGSFSSNRGGSGKNTPTPASDLAGVKQEAESPQNQLQAPSSPTPSPAAGDASDNKNDEVPMTFPQRLMEILSKPEHSDIISWLDHGKGFMIYQKKRFASEVAPKYFKQSKYTSFTRKLNRWGFIRVSRGPETGAYYHRFFQQNNLRLCLQMTCQPSKPCPPMSYMQSPVVSPIDKSMDMAISPVGRPIDMTMATANLQTSMQTNSLNENIALYGRQEATQKMLAAAAARRETLMRLTQLQQQQLELLRQQTSSLNGNSNATNPQTPQQQIQLPLQQTPYLNQTVSPQQQQLELLRQQAPSLNQNATAAAQPFYPIAPGQGMQSPFSSTSRPTSSFNSSQMMEAYLAMVRNKAQVAAAPTPQAPTNTTTPTQQSLLPQPTQATIPKPPSPESKSQSSIFPNAQSVYAQASSSSKSEKRKPSGARRASAA